MALKRGEHGVLSFVRVTHVQLGAVLLPGSKGRTAPVIGKHFLGMVSKSIPTSENEVNTAFLQAILNLVGVMFSVLDF